MALAFISVLLCKYVLYGAFVWARRALNGLKRRFPARAVVAKQNQMESPDWMMGLTDTNLELQVITWAYALLRRLSSYVYMDTVHPHHTCIHSRTPKLSYHDRRPSKLTVQHSLC